MLLVVDAGNTHTVLGLFAGDQFRGHWRIVTSNYRTSDELGLLLHMLLDHIGVKPEQISGCCVSSVVPQWNPALVAVSRQFFGIEPLMVEPGVKTGLVLQCDNPREVGADRVVNAVAAYEKYGGSRPLIIVDFGTATTFCVVTAQGEYLGGAIAPGVGISTEALFTRTAKLPRVELVRPKSVIGKNTVMSMQSGIIFGFVGQVEGIVKRMKEEIGQDALVVATGGLAEVISREADCIDIVDPVLTLEGLLLIYEKNR
ncbi:MAG TPA: type III pantothenate kinase [Candidatus Hydrogenedentes bacterium]|nr:type III pantothenate kinase [Candidatus Hydrogenedentota bacterium]